MSGFFQRNRDRGQFRGQGDNRSNFNQGSFQQQSNFGRQQMMNPWQSGIMPVGGGLQSGQSDEAALAFNILNQVLASDTPMMNTGMNQGGGFQDRKGRQGLGNRLQDRRRGQSPQFSNRNRGDGGRQWSSRSRSPHGRDDRSNSRRNSNDRNRKSVLERLGERKVPDKNRNSKERSKERTPSDKRRKSKERQSQDKSSKEDGSDCEKAVDESSEPKSAADKENEELDVKCLKCHICEEDNFDSMESFRNHKLSDEHKLLMDIYNERSEVALQLMRADAKLAANREREKSGNANRESFYTRCPKCDCIVADAFKSHKKSIEHELVDHQLFRECCGSTFIKRREFEKHRLTIPHLKKQVDKKVDSAPEEKVVMAYGEDEETAASFLRDFKTKHNLELESPADFPEYDSEKPIGLGYIHKKRRYNCTVCNKSFPPYNNMALAHCRSFNHYLMLMAKLAGQLKEVEDEEMPEVEEKKEDEETVKEEEENTEKSSEVIDTVDKEKEENSETKENEEVDKENEHAEADEDVVDEEMGENMPPLDEGAIDLEDKAADDELEAAIEPDNEYAEEEAEDDHMSNDGQEEQPEDDGNAEADNEAIEEMESSEATKEEEETPVNAEEEEQEPEEEVPVKRRPQRAKRARGRVNKHF